MIHQERFWTLWWGQTHDHTQKLKWKLYLPIHPKKFLAFLVSWLTIVGHACFGWIYFQLHVLVDCSTNQQRWYLLCSVSKTFLIFNSAFLHCYDQRNFECNILTCINFLVSSDFSNMKSWWGVKSSWYESCRLCVVWYTVAHIHFNTVNSSVQTVITYSLNCTNITQIYTHIFKLLCYQSSLGQALYMFLG